MAWSFITDELNLEKDRLWITIFKTMMRQQQFGLIKLEYLRTDLFDWEKSLIFGPWVIPDHAGLAVKSFMIMEITLTGDLLELPMRMVTAL